MKSTLLCFLTIAVMFSVNGQACPFTLPAKTPIDQPLIKGIVAEPSPSPKIFIRCASTINSETRPLVVVDGIVVDEAGFRSLNPADIEEIHVLKDAAAIAIYSCRVPQGVIIIVTRKAQHRSFVVRNANSLMGIPSATIRAEFRKNSNAFTFTADEFGRVETDSLRSLDFQVTISAAGYRSKRLDLRQILKNKGEILLEKDPLTQSRENSHAGLIRIYPTSVGQGGMVHLSFVTAKTGVYNVRVFTAGGQLIQQVQKTIMNGATERLQLSKTIATGMCIIQVLDEKSKVLETAKLMVR